MNPTPQTRSEQKIDLLLQQLDPGSERYGVLNSAKNFKSSWVELGQQLQTVRHQRLFAQWGYDSFEDYCSREIRIRRQTADKLTLAYHYLEQNNPKLMAQTNSLTPLPDFRSIDLLCQAQNNSNFSDDEQNELQQAVFDGKLSHPTIAKRFKEIALQHALPSVRQCADYQSALSAARRLRTALDRLPPEVAATAQALPSLIETLEQALELMQSSQPSATP